jgi:dienelactone hydrolase
MGRLCQADGEGAAGFPNDHPGGIDRHPTDSVGTVHRSIVAVVAIVLVATAACTGLEPLTETTSEVIAFESVDLPGRLWDPFMPPLTDGPTVMVEGRLTVPPTEEPVPVVIITHGCSGIGSGSGWEDELGDAGFATFEIDSFGGRGVTEICSGRETLNVLSPVVDVYRAADLLDDHPYIDASRIAVLGFSFGGRSSIWSGFTRFQEAYGGRAFAGHLAFYPSTCFIELADEDLAGVPLRIFHGTEDDWTPIDQCQTMVDRLVADGEDAVIHAYQGAAHAFDNVGLAWSVSHFHPDGVSPAECTFVEEDGAIIDTETGSVAGVGSTCVRRGVTYAYDADARRAAASDLIADLTAMFGP